jgi:hypothetical protein
MCYVLWYMCILNGCMLCFGSLPMDPLWTPHGAPMDTERTIVNTTEFTGAVWPLNSSAVCVATFHSRTM